MGDQELYQKIGQLLVDAGPADAREIIVRVELFSEGDGGRYEFDYVNQSGGQGKLIATQGYISFDGHFIG